MSNEQNPEITREEMEVDVLIVGGGAAGLSCAIHLKNQIDAHNQAITDGKSTAEPINDPMIVVLEKGSEIGAQSLSGAVLNPIALRELIPNYKELGCPINTEVGSESFVYLSQTGSFNSPIIPPPFHNKGNYIISLAQYNRWLGQQAEAKGINIFPGFSGVEVLFDGDKVVGVRTGDKGIGKNGEPQENFEPGMLIKSKITVFCDGTRSPLLKRVSEKLGLREGRNPESFELGVKEIIQMPPGTVKAGHVTHTLGFPLDKSVGGTFIYNLKDDQIVVGICVYFDTKDPLLDVHRELQKLKSHPYMRKMLEGGQVISYGGKTLPAGGWFSMPKLYHDGMMVCGDSAAMVDVKKLKGIHLAMKSGMLAAETALEALVKKDYSAATLKAYDDRINNSYVKKDLWKTRNFHQALSKGIFASMPEIMLQEITGGRGLVARRRMDHEDWQTTRPVEEVWGADWQKQFEMPAPDGKLFFDKLSSVYLTGTMHDEHSQNHLKVINTNVCVDECYPKYKSPCNHFCPANVYEMVDDAAARESASGKKRLQVNYTNCIHCQSCDIKCNFNNIDWTLPEGGGGPNYKDL
jgi:electron-transferring-flavoprotein dehydrogenase